MRSPSRGTIIIIASLFGACAHAGELLSTDSTQVTLVGDDRIPELDIHISRVRLTSVVNVKIHFFKPNTELLIKDKLIMLDDNGHAELNLPVGSSQGELFKFYSVDPYGQTNHEQVFVELPEDIQPRPWNVSLGSTYYNYSQTGISPFSALAATVKFAALVNLLARTWGLTLDAFGSVLPQASNFGTVFFVGGNGLILYRFPAFTIGVGVYYLTTMTGGQFGFLNAVSPELMLNFHVRRWSIYGKYASVIDPVNGFVPGNYEISGGLGYTFPLRNEHPVTIQLEAVDLVLNLGGNLISSNSYELSVGYGF